MIVSFQAQLEDIRLAFGNTLTNFYDNITITKLQNDQMISDIRSYIIPYSI